MFQGIKNKICWSVILMIILVSAFAGGCIVKDDAIVTKLKKNGYVSFSVLLYGTEKTFPRRLDSYVVLYDKKNNILKVLSINVDAVVFKKKERSLRVLFNENFKKENIDVAAKEFYSNLQEMSDGSFNTDFYVNLSFEQLNAIMSGDKKLKDILSKDNFEDENLESLNRLETVEYILRLMPRRSVRIYKNYDFLDTDISRFLFMKSVLRLRFLKPMLVFCLMPVQYARGRTEPDKQNIKEFLRKIYFTSGTLEINAKDAVVDVKNASGQSRIAEKVAWLLRENKFDVLDWSNSTVAYNKTFIKDYKGNFMQDLKMSEILNSVKIIISYDNKTYYDARVFVGKDYVSNSCKKS